MTPASRPAANPLLRSRWLKRLAIAVTVIGVLWISPVLLAVNMLTTRSRRPFAEPIPESIGKNIESRRIQTSDRHELGAWFARGNNDRPAVLLMHGNGGARSSRVSELQFLIEQRSSVLTLTMRSHGDSTGEQNDFGYSARHDVIAAVRELKSLCPEQRLCVWSGSLSAAAAIFAAPELANDVDKWLLECPYCDLETAVRRRLGIVLPISLVPLAHWNLLRGADVMLPHWREISPLNAARQFPRETAVTLIVGEHDTRATPSDSQQIAAAIGDRARVVIVTGAGHLNTFAVDRGPYAEWLQAAPFDARSTERSSK